LKQSAASVINADTSYFLIKLRLNQEKIQELKDVGIMSRFSFQIFSQLAGIPQLKPSAIISGNSTTFLLLQKSSHYYLDDSFKESFTVSSSATPHDNNIMWLVISFSSNTVLAMTQIVDYDVLTLIGVLTGALAFWKSLYTLFMAIANRFFFKHNQPSEMPKKFSREPLLGEKADANL